jgi:hypothetical protein
MPLLLLMKSKHRFCIMDSDAPAALPLSPQLTTSSWDEQVLAFRLAQPKPDIELVCHGCCYRPTLIFPDFSLFFLTF